MKKKDLAIWVEANDGVLSDLVARVQVLEANQNYLARDYNAAVEFKNLAKAVRENRAAENKGGMTLTAEQVLMLRDLRERIREYIAIYAQSTARTSAETAIDEVLEVIDEILK